MIEVIEFRIPEEHARRFLDAGFGTLLGDTVRKIEVSTSDPVIQEIREVDRMLREQGDMFFTYWEIRRKYTPTELRSASLLRLFPRSRNIFEPPGEISGTTYDDSSSCGSCGAHRLQTSELKLHSRQIPKAIDIAVTIAYEWIVSARLASVLREFTLDNVSLQPVIDASSGSVNEGWLQLVSRECTLWLDERTRFGINPFDEDPSGVYRCPHQHVAGLNLLSELWITRESWDGSDLNCTVQHVGVRRGVLVPHPFIVMSAELHERLQKEDIRGLHVEVVNLVD